MKEVINLPAVEQDPRKPWLKKALEEIRRNPDSIDTPNLFYYLKKAEVLDGTASSFATIALFDTRAVINRALIPDAYLHLHTPNSLLEAKPFISDRPDLLASIDSLIKVMAITREYVGDYWKASRLYEGIGMTEKAQEMEKLVPPLEETFTKEYKDAQSKASLEREKTEDDENSPWKNARLEFQEAEKQNEISESERNDAINHIREYLEQRMGN